MRTRLFAGFFIGLVAMFALSFPQAMGQDSSLKKINPFGKKEENREIITKRKEKEASAGPQRMLRPLTPAGVKENLGKIGQSTRNAFSRTKSALTPEKKSLPKLRLPKLNRRQKSQEPVAVKKKKPESKFSLVSWLFPATESKSRSKK